MPYFKGDFISIIKLHVTKFNAESVKIADYQTLEPDFKPKRECVYLKNQHVDPKDLSVCTQFYFNRLGLSSLAAINKRASDTNVDVRLRFLKSIISQLATIRRVGFNGGLYRK